MSNLRDTWVVLGPQLLARQVGVTPGVFEQLDREFEGFHGHLLVSMYAFDSDWSTWEAHPHGDEVVVLLSGVVDMVLDRGGRHETIRLAQAGDYVLVPKGTWHTARVAAAASMIFITAGEGTQHDPRGKESE